MADDTTYPMTIGQDPLTKNPLYKMKAPVDMTPPVPLNPLPVNTGALPTAPPQGNDDGFGKFVSKIGKFYGDLHRSWQLPNGGEQPILQGLPQVQGRSAVDLLKPPATGAATLPTQPPQNESGLPDAPPVIGDTKSKGVFGTNLNPNQWAQLWGGIAAGIGGPKSPGGRVGENLANYGTTQEANERQASKDRLAQMYENERLRLEQEGITERTLYHQAKLGQGEKDPDKIREFEMVSGMKPAQRGTPEYQKAFGTMFPSAAKTGAEKTPMPTTDKGYTVTYDPNRGINIASKVDPLSGQLVSEPLDPEKHGQVQQTAMPAITSYMSGQRPVGTPEQQAADVKAVMNNQMTLDDVAKGGGMGGLGAAYARQVRTAVLKENPYFNFTVQKIAAAGDRAEITALQGQRGKIMAYETNAEQNAKQVYQLAGQIEVSRIPALNALILKGETRVAGNTVESNYLLAWRTFINEYARVTTTATGGGVTSDEARKEIEEVLRSSGTPDQVQANMRQAVLEMMHRRYGYDKQLADAFAMGGIPKTDQPVLPTAEDVYKIFEGKAPQVTGEQNQGKGKGRFITGKIYTDKQGRKAKYLGDGKWQLQ